MGKYFFLLPSIVGDHIGHQLMLFVFVCDVFKDIQQLLLLFRVLSLPRLLLLSSSVYCFFVLMLSQAQVPIAEKVDKTETQ